jgi:hypothetical protein
VQDYHWFTDVIADLAATSGDARENLAILGLGGVISTFVEEADLSNRDTQRLEAINSDLIQRLEAADRVAVKAASAWSATVP